MNFPSELKYTASHEWVKILGDGSCEIGLTDYAQNELGDIVFVNLPQVGDSLTAGASFADVESVKAVSDIFSPVNGSVKEINQGILDSPESINKAPYEAWFIRAVGESPAGELISAAEYEALVNALPKG
ncbi:MAG: glycine cleavage system protein GcvH [Treponema sp.]|jgi:glycine cleavage system H protein|nr:glycine cleavage system protein GcvH [Treponema sp.]